MKKLFERNLKFIGMGKKQEDFPEIDLSDRVAIFIDGSNLYHSLEENCNRFDVDFNSLTRKLCKGRKLYRVYYYNVTRDSDREQQAFSQQKRFFGALYNTPFLEVRLGNYKLRKDQAVEKGVDIMMATDLLQYAWADLYDVAIMVTGDGDFSYAVKTVKDLGKHVEVAAFEANLSLELLQIADSREFLTPEYFKELWSKEKSTTTDTKTRSHSSSRTSTTRYKKRTWNQPKR
ncbi:MAG: NYN domain-containing protein [SAR202 cluster bacterium]|nr:NYN domain-containing protein [SAR202 cluster bacterium]